MVMSAFEAMGFFDVMAAFTLLIRYTSPHLSPRIALSVGQSDGHAYDPRVFFNNVGYKAQGEDWPCCRCRHHFLNYAALLQFPSEGFVLPQKVPKE